MAQRLTLLASINSFTGYGAHAIELARGLSRWAHVAIRPITAGEMFGARIPEDIRARFVNGPQPEPWEILLHPPNFAPTPGKKTLYFTMWETSRMPPAGVAVLNRAEVVVVPNRWNAGCMSAEGVDKPIRIVPLGINTEVFRYRQQPESDLCVFGAAGRMAHGGSRKGINEVIALFQEAFEYQQDVRLRVKCWPDCPVHKPQDPRIEVTQKYLTDGELSDWYNGLNCFVSAAKGEGWGLMQHQALATGRPVITINYAGISEFFSSEFGYEVPFRLERAELAYRGCGAWAVPDGGAIIRAMREVYQNRQEAARRGAAGAMAAREFSWEKSHQAMAEVLREFQVL